jgi:SAM-dependent methyltransferase
MEENEYRHMVEAGERHWWYSSTRSLLDQLVTPHLAPITPETRYLDAAGGSGATGRWLAERATTALDDYEPMALVAAASAYPGFRPVRADIKYLPHPDGCFDAVLCVTALYHQLNPDPQAVVREFARVAKPGGLVCLMEPGVRRLRRGHDAVTHTARRFSRGDLSRLITGADLELVRATGAYSFLVPPAAAMAVLERGEAKSDVARNEGGAGGMLSAVAKAERGLLKRIDLPFGLSVIAIGRKR